MANNRAYSNLFSCIYDEMCPVGNLGRGTHYSIFRSVEWLDVMRLPLKLPEIHDFSIVWDEDHDERVISVVEDIYMAGLLSPVQFIGERKGTLTVIVAAKFYFGHSEKSSAQYLAEIEKIASNSRHGDGWPVELGYFDRSPGFHHQTELKALIAAEEHRVDTFVRNVDSLWGLGTKPFVGARSSSLGVTPPAPPVMSAPFLG